jgi:hypothetical protein
MDHIIFSGFGCFANGFRYFSRFTAPETDTTTTIADYNQSSERKSPTALHNLGDTIDAN